MRDILSDVDRWINQGGPIALATVVDTWGSAPRKVGAKMAFTPEGEIAGSVSGGCVEGAVYEAGLGVIRTGAPERVRFGVADEDAWNVGLACGGQIDIFIQVLNVESYKACREALNRDEPVARVSVIAGPGRLLGSELLVLEEGVHYGSIGDDLTTEGVEAGRLGLASGTTVRTIIRNGTTPVELLVEVYPPSPLLVVVGGVHIALALVKFARVLGYRTVVIDPRRAFGSEGRFPEVDRLIQAWPAEGFKQLKLTASSAVVMLTHDPKIDDPAFMETLASPAFFIGALGSRSTHARRRQRLQEAGLSEDLVDRIHGPVGLDLGGQSPEEIALGIMAQIIAARYQPDWLGGDPAGKADS